MADNIDKSLAQAPQGIEEFRVVVKELAEKGWI